MIAYSETALRLVDELIDYYTKKNRPEAARNLLAALQAAEREIENETRRWRQFPATYHDLIFPGRRWIKQGRYWVAYTASDPPAITAVFWERADIPRRDPDRR